MPSFLIDVNLPYYFSLWHTADFIHVKDLNDEWKDSEIWNYALQNNLIIITKDADFFDRVMVTETHPKVIHIGFGNLKMKEFFEAMIHVWPQVTALNKDFRLLQIFTEKLVVIK